MRLYTIAILVSLSACASVPSGNDVSARVASWHGAPAADLVTILGEPEITKHGSWVWQFAGPGHGEVAACRCSTNSAPRLRLGPMSQVCQGCAPPEGVSSQSFADKMPYRERRGHYQKHVVCKYIGDIENGVVTKLTTQSKPANDCRFDELPLHSG